VTGVQTCALPFCHKPRFPQNYHHLAARRQTRAPQTTIPSELPPSRRPPPNTRATNRDSFRPPAMSPPAAKHARHKPGFLQNSHHLTARRETRPPQTWITSELPPSRPRRQTRAPHTWIPPDLRRWRRLLRWPHAIDRPGFPSSTQSSGLDSLRRCRRTRRKRLGNSVGRTALAWIPLLRGRRRLGNCR
jgi:hypothetical protein